MEFARYIVTRSTSAAAGGLVSIVQAFAVLDSGARPFYVGVVLACSVFGQATVLPLGGYLTDRISNRFLMFSGNAILAAIYLVVGFTLIATSGQVPILFFVLVAIAGGSVSGILQPTFQGAVAGIVPRQSAQRAHAISRATLNVCSIGVPALGALLGEAFGYGSTLLASAGLFGACAALASKGREDQTRRVSRSFVRGIREGWSEFVSRRWLLLFVLRGSLAVPLWLAGFRLLGPIVAASNGGIRTWGWAVSSFSVGTILGSLIPLRWQPSRPMLSAVLSQVVWPLPLLFLASGIVGTWLSFAMLVSGASIGLTSVLFQATQQQQVPREAIGRTTSVAMLAEFILLPIGYLLAGLGTALLTPAFVLWLCFGGILALTVALLFVSEIRLLRRLEVGAV